VAWDLRDPRCGQGEPAMRDVIQFPPPGRLRSSTSMRSTPSVKPAAFSRPCKSGTNGSTTKCRAMMLLIIRAHLDAAVDRIRSRPSGRARHGLPQRSSWSPLSPITCRAPSRASAERSLTDLECFELRWLPIRGEKSLVEACLGVGDALDH
jgi:hypothetical protein